MQSKLLLAALGAAGLAALGAAGLASAESVIGLYAFHRHGDRTAKSWQPVNLTSLGADEVFSSGTFFRERYLNNDGLRIAGMSADRAVLSQLAVTAPADNVLHNSAAVFLQGLFPPSAAATRETLANGTVVQSPLGGYQYIPVGAISAVTGSASAADSESSSWLQGASGCAKAVVSSNNYLQSPEYIETAAQTRDFYQSLLPVINGTFDAASAVFKNGYTIFDLVNVAEIHNASIPAKQLLTKPTLARLYDLASTHEWNLAFNASDPVRAISGAVLAGQVLASLSAIAEPSSTAAPLFNAQFGAYAAFMSFFGLAGLHNVSPDFMGVVDYASAMVFELVAPQATGWSADDLSVRFWFSNGTASAESFRSWPLFGSDSTSMGWKEFKAEMGKVAVGDTASWCDMCGNTEGPCASSSASASSSSSSSSEGGKLAGKGGSGGISKAVAGVIGALVTLVVILLVEAAVLVLGRLRLVKKSTLAAAKSG